MVAERRDECKVLAEQQAALRRVATLVARGVTPAEVFDAVANELAGCVGVRNTALCRYESDGSATLLAAHDVPERNTIATGARVAPDGHHVEAKALRTARAARIDNIDSATSAAAAPIRAKGMRSAVSAPILVDGRVWGVAIVGSRQPEPLPPDTETRLGEFADLVATAIATAQGRAELAASRARIVTAADEARRRLERDLHDGAQQRLVSLGIQLRLAQDSLPAGLRSIKDQLSDIASGLTAVSVELQDISRGIHPAILSNRGLGPALKALARRSSVPVTVEARLTQRLPDYAEVAAYYVVAEALTNAAKHAHASEVNVSVTADDQHMHLVIRDDGVGGAAPHKGSGLIGLTDRVEALGGHIEITSPARRGTRLRVRIPVGSLPQGPR